MDEEKIKQAFSSVKQDILNLQSQLSDMKQEIKKLTRTLDTSTLRQQTSTDRREISTYQQTSTDNSTRNYPLEALKTANSNISTGNKGVSTDSQTDSQTDKNNQKFVQILENTPEKQVLEVVNSLNTIKKELKQKFMSLTKQEFLVFSAIYQLEEQGNIVDYCLLSKRLNLSESSMRDYIQRMLKKQIPIIKTRENNKKILVSISPNLRKLASLPTIIKIREENRLNE